MGVWGGGCYNQLLRNDPLPAGFLFLVFEFSFIWFVVDARRVFFWCIINITISKKHLFFFSLLDSSSTHFVITATTATTTTCHHHQQQPQTVPVATPPSTTTNGKLHAHLLSEYYGINGDTPAPDNRTAAQPQFFLVSLMGHNLYLK